MRKTAQKLPKKRDKPPQQNKHEENNVLDLWMREEGRDAYITGTGTSMSGFNWKSLNDVNGFTIALNDAVLVPGYAPDYHIFSDVGIWTRYRNFHLEKKTKMICQRRARDQFLRYESCANWRSQIYHFNHVAQCKQCQPDNDDLYVQRTIATAAIMMAWKLGAYRIYLLGVDGFKITSGAYYWDGSKKPNDKRKESQLGHGRAEQDRHQAWQDNMRDLKTFFKTLNLYPGPWKGSGIYNLSWHSTIDAWEKIDWVRLRKEIGRQPNLKQ